MDGLGIILVLAFIGWLMLKMFGGMQDGGYRRGKQEGSRKGYHAGYQQAKRDQGSGCLIVLMIFSATAVAAACLR
jgi:hypothetical protein